MVAFKKKKNGWHLILTRVAKRKCSCEVSDSGEPGQPEWMFRKQTLASILNITNYDVTPTGTFVAIQRSTEGLPHNIRVIVGLESRLSSHIRP